VTAKAKKPLQPILGTLIVGGLAYYIHEGEGSRLEFQPCGPAEVRVEDKAALAALLAKFEGSKRSQDYALKKRLEIMAGNLCALEQELGLREVTARSCDDRGKHDPHTWTNRYGESFECMGLTYDRT